MATTSKKQEPIFIQIGEKRIELNGQDLIDFIDDKNQSLKTIELLEKQLLAQKELKISAYKKLGLTDEEINAII